MKPRFGIAAVVGAFALCASTAGAALPSGNLLVNGGAEAGPGATTDADVVPPPGWATTGQLTAYAYGTPDSPDGASIGGGTNYFAGGNAALSTASQTVALSGAAAEIDAGRAAAVLSADLGGYETQEDNAVVTAVFRNAAGATLGTLQTGPVTEADRKGVTVMLPRSSTAAVPPGTRSATVTLTATRTEGVYDDGYADNISLTLGPAVPPRPRAGVRAAAATVKGVVLVRLPGKKGFVPLGPTGTIPVGATVDASKGSVRLTVAVERGGKHSGVFTGGVFKFTQPRERVHRHRRLTAHLALTGGSFAACSATRRSDAGAARRRVVRYLSASAHGRFRVIGRYSSGLERGTAWKTSDGCDGTLTTVSKGAVLVTDRVRHRTVLVRAHHSYLARARSRRR